MRRRLSIGETRSILDDLYGMGEEIFEGAEKPRTTGGRGGIRWKEKQPQVKDCNIDGCPLAGAGHPKASNPGRSAGVLFGGISPAALAWGCSFLWERLVSTGGGGASRSLEGSKKNTVFLPAF